MEKDIAVNTTLIAACGLYCGECGSYKKGKCAGCKENTKASWCKVRSCCKEKSVDNCSQCTEFDNPEECSKYNMFISRIIGFVTGTKRALNIEAIKKMGPDGFVSYMVENKWQSIPKKIKISN
jgi:hypothetical protein